MVRKVFCRMSKVFVLLKHKDSYEGNFQEHHKDKCTSSNTGKKGTGLLEVRGHVSVGGQALSGYKLWPR